MSTVVGLSDGRGTTRLDAALSLLAVGGLIACVIAAFSEGDGRAEAGPAETRVGQTTVVVDEAMLRRASSLVWSRAREGDALSVGDVLYVPAGSELHISLLGGAGVSLAEKSLVVLDGRRPEGARRLDVKRGSVLAAAAVEPVVVDTGPGDLLLPPGAAGEVTTEESGAARVQVLAGEGRLRGRGRDVSVGTRSEWLLSADGELVERRGIAVGLRAPAHRARVYAEGEIAIRFSWRRGEGVAGHPLRLEVRRAGRLVYDVPLEAEQRHAELLLPGPGVYRWRIDDETPGEHATPRRTLVVVAPVAPVPLEPPDGTALTLDGARAVVFAWSAVEGARAYRLRLMSIEGEHVNMQVELASRRHRHEQPLPRGRYLWTIEAIFDDGPVPRSPPALLLVDTAPPPPVDTPSASAPDDEPTTPDEAPDAVAPPASQSSAAPAATFEWTKPRREVETSWGAAP